MNIRKAVSLAGLVGPLALGIVGCSASQEMSVEEMMEVRGDAYHEWQRVYTVNIEDGAQVREHVGFIDRRYTADDPEGKLFVLDLLHRRRGFILPSGKAYAFTIRDNQLIETEDLGNRGKDSGVKAILGATGRVDYETVTEASTSPPPQG